MPRLLPVLRRQAPGVDVVTRFLGDDFDRAVQAREVDFAYGTRFRALSGLSSSPHSGNRPRASCSAADIRARPAHDLRRYTALDHVLVWPPGTTGSAIDTALEPLGLSRRVVYGCPTSRSGLRRFEDRPRGDAAGRTSAECRRVLASSPCRSRSPSPASLSRSATARASKTTARALLGPASEWWMRRARAEAKQRRAQ